MADPLSTSGYKNIRAPRLSHRIDNLMLACCDVLEVACPVFPNRAIPIIYMDLNLQDIYIRYISVFDENEIISITARQSVFNSCLASAW